MTLRVTLEIVPFGDETQKRVIETINISNRGKNEFDERYEYIVEHNDYKNFTDETPRVLHFREYGAIELARKALERLTNEIRKR